MRGYRSACGNAASARGKTECGQCREAREAQEGEEGCYVRHAGARLHVLSLRRDLYDCGRGARSLGAISSVEPGCMVRVQIGKERGLLMALRKPELRIEELRDQLRADGLLWFTNSSFGGKSETQRLR